MLWLKARGVQRYDLGFQYFGAQFHHVPGPKELSISLFKRGFGGQTRRVPMSEYFYSDAVLEQVTAERLQALVASRSVLR
jgi:hypothetical protein